ncbi:MAG: bifunctional UDP-N-acetylmuramoyl-tripeptide:D-alanyl-D-alanine ligase/alanine racemase [Cytophagales bacterium]|nr:bifunctional UDP-N-acetylmuramoyl-tripeptide:D-alanyl-D-alanine ligase/alanine racemase [Cytophagales bacterium]
MFLFSELPGLLGGHLLQLHHDTTISHLLTDSRKPVLASGAVFFALRGERHNGHRFLDEIYRMGIRLFVVEQADTHAWELRPQASVLQVDSTLAALQQLAVAHRARFTIPLVGITGSNGKTIVKEWLADALARRLRTWRSPKSYNSQVGVPLSIWGLEERHQVAVIEAGISQVGEMDKLQAIIRPTLGIFTNLGSAHDEGFASREQKCREKLRLFASCERLIYRDDDAELRQWVQAFLPSGVRHCSWSFGRADSWARVRRTERGFVMKVEYLEIDIRSPWSDPASVENLLHVVATLVSLGWTSAEIQAAVDDMRPVQMRLQLKQGKNNCYLIDDSYNNDLAGLKIALDFLAQQGQRPQKTLIISDILESGLPQEEVFAELARLAAAAGLYRIIGVGPSSMTLLPRFLSRAVAYPDTEAFLKAAPIFRDETVLVKGARRFGFERIVALLESKTHGTRLEIDLDALTHNLNYYRGKLQPGTRLMVMVKALAYGSGSVEVAHLLQFHQVDYLAVAYTDEGVFLRRQGIHLPIMVMNVREEDFAALAEHGLEPEMYSINQLARFQDFLHRTNGQAAIHLKLDTGMKRLGLEELDLPTLLALLERNRVKVVSVFSHLAGADDARHSDFSQQQYERFLAMSAILAAELPEPPMRHLLNSPGIVRFPHMQMEMVRLGIGLYGVEANGLEQNQLLPISTLKTTISQLKQLQPGETVGYGRSGRVERPSTIATIGIGYADGFRRTFSQGHGRVYIQGHYAPVVGKVCMDMCMVDVTGLEVQEGDEVEIFGSHLPIQELAERLGTIPYEVLTNVSERVKRVFWAS